MIRRNEYSGQSSIYIHSILQTYIPYTMYKSYCIASSALCLHYLQFFHCAGKQSRKEGDGKASVGGVNAFQSTRVEQLVSVKPIYHIT